MKAIDFQYFLLQKSFEKLTHLDLFNNDVCNVDDYRAKVFSMLPSLKFLDDADVDGNELEDSDAEEGQNGTLDDEEGSDEDGKILFHDFEGWGGLMSRALEYLSLRNSVNQNN